MGKDFVIGVLGGMGTYATIHMFKQYAEIFVAEKEWERPRIIIDNRCTMPSRVRAFLFQENVEQLVAEMTESMQELVNAGCTRIILACNTSHLFLPQIYEKVPELRGRVMHAIHVCVDKIAEEGVSQAYLLGSEGTIDSHIYQDALCEKGIECVVPDKDEYSMLRKCIEAVKQNQYSEGVREMFLKLINRNNCCILGCTELPILYEKYSEYVTCKRIYDPISIVLHALKKEYSNE